MTDSQGQAGAEIEITPAMIEAGVPFLLQFDVEWQDQRSVVHALLEAALAARQGVQSRSSSAV